MMHFPWFKKKTVSHEDKVAPVKEMADQTRAMREKAARDIEKTFQKLLEIKEATNGVD